MTTNSEIGEYLVSLPWFVKALTENKMSFLLLDSEYSLPDSNWLTTDFANFYLDFISKIGVWQWVENVMDCDKFTRLYTTLAWMCHVVYSAGKSKELLTKALKTGFAVGLFVYRPDNADGAHMISIGFERIEGKLQHFFIEPQTRKKVSLTETELCSCALLLV